MINTQAVSIASAVLASAGIAASTGAEEVRIEFEATVAENQHLTGPYAGVALGETMTVTMNLIAPAWLDEYDSILGEEYGVVVSHYAIDSDSFVLSIEGATATNNPNVDVMGRSVAFWNDWPVADGFIADLGMVADNHTASFHMDMHNNTGEMLSSTDITQEAGERIFGWDPGQVPYDSGAWRMSYPGSAGGGTIEGLFASMTIHEICVADLDEDGQVGFTDLSTLLGVWGCPACIDLDGDGGPTGFGDLTTLLGAWGDCQ